MKYVLLGLFLLVSVIHLAAAFFGKEKLRKVSKMFLMPFLLAYFIAARGSVYLPVLFALIFAFLGDYFLLEPQKRIRFQLGLASFLIGHLCYIPAFISHTASFHIPVFIISYIIAAAIGIFIFKKLNPVKNMIIPVMAYMIIILNMSVFALQMMLSNLMSWSVMVFIGSVLFICSDTILAFVTFHTMPKRGNFLVMIFYITAQAFIVIGLSRVIS
ncbi:MAG: lysoplasmalogenase [Treponema sp.]|jgi:uncharacterized membrane protein YhhN|nr:lysoplasmalogenase [Treponema sp.]